MRHAIQGGGKIPVDDSGNVPVSVSNPSGADPLPVEAGPYDYVACPVDTVTILGTTGAAGDYLHSVTFRMVGAVSFTLRDDTTNLFVYTGTADTNTIHTIILDAVCITNWTIQTQAGVQAIATGRFT